MNGNISQIHTAAVVKHGKTLIVPETMSYGKASELLALKEKEEETLVKVQASFETFPWDGAYALSKVMQQRFGIVIAKSTYGMFGNEIPPSQITIETGPNTTEAVHWGQLRWPFAEKGDDEQVINTSADLVDGRVVFQLSGQLRKKFVPEFNALCEDLRTYLKTNSIYKGKSIRIAFTNDDGDHEQLPTPRFLDMSSKQTEIPIYTRELEQLIATNIMTPIKHADACRASNIPLKRGVLLAGPYGTGKSLLAREIGKAGNAYGWTFVYLKHATDLPEAIRFAKMYQPCVIFAEDVDRCAGAERTEQLNLLLNTLDGIDTKNDEVLVVLTTNHLEDINRAMLRPGRLDVVLHITPPDEEAVQRLIREYGVGLVAENTDLKEVGTMLAGYTPAVIREVVERAKLGTIARTGKAGSSVLGEDLVVSARLMIQQMELMADTKETGPSPADAFVGQIATAVTTLVDERIGHTVEKELDKKL